MMQEIINGLELLTLISNLFFVLIILLFISKLAFGKNKMYDAIVYFFQNHYLFFGILVSLTATLGSLFYSDIVGYEPCKLCWYQRIFMYPQLILFLVALKIKQKKTIIFNSVSLSIIGGLIAVYHYLLQRGVINAASCSIVGYSANCSEYFSLAYGYITIPIISLSAFIILIILGYWKMKDLLLDGLNAH